MGNMVTRQNSADSSQYKASQLAWDLLKFDSYLKFAQEQVTLLNPKALCIKRVFHRAQINPFLACSLLKWVCSTHKTGCWSNWVPVPEEESLDLKHLRELNFVHLFLLRLTEKHIASLNQQGTWHHRHQPDASRKPHKQLMKAVALHCCGCHTEEPCNDYKE